MRFKFILFLILITITACKPRNKLNSNEQALSKQILSEEEQLAQEAAQRAEREKQLADSIAKRPKGFRFKEDRSINPQNPPVIIDIQGTSENIRDFKLSDVASSIRYIKLETPSDTSLLWIPPNLSDRILSVYSDDNHILIQNLFGVTRFTMDGKFRELIWKNKSGINVAQNFVSWHPGELFGITPNNPVSLFNGKLYMRFQDGSKGKVQIMNKEIQNEPVLNNPSKQKEAGIDTLVGNKLLSIKEKYMSFRYPLIYGLGQNCWVGIDDSWNSVKAGTLFVVFDNNGDTLCTVANTNKITNWTKTRYRAGEPFTYYYKNHLTFIGQHADTIFRFIPPNRILPVYVLDFGKDKVSFMEGLDPDSDLSQKLMLNSIFETDKYIFIRYTRNNASPANLKNKSVTFYNAIFDKTANKLYHLPGQSFKTKNIGNDIDGGISFWPEFVTPNGSMMMLATGEQIKQYVNSDEFIAKKPSQNQRQKYIDMANNLGNNEIVVMLVK